MQSSINLATPKTKESLKLQKLLIVSLAVFGVTFFFAISLLAYFLNLKGQYSQLEKDEQQTRAELNALATERVNALVFKDRLLHTSKLLESRGDLNEKVAAVLSLVPSPLTIAGLSLMDSSLELSLESPDLALFNDLIEKRIQEIQQLQGVTIHKTDIKGFQFRSEDRTYLMSLVFEFKAQQ